MMFFIVLALEAVTELSRRVFRATAATALICNMTNEELMRVLLLTESFPEQ